MLLKKRLLGESLKLRQKTQFLHPIFTLKGGRFPPAKDNIFTFKALLVVIITAKYLLTEIHTLIEQ